MYQRVSIELQLKQQQPRPTELQKQQPHTRSSRNTAVTGMQEQQQLGLLHTAASASSATCLALLCWQLQRPHGVVVGGH
jgi:hypothetical protein